ncbi:MAG TPA: response regulator [Reyranella sp.]|jgi:CheY-like chemotaxis protein|nr:response regulator [Reyranella sp.]
MRRVLIVEDEVLVAALLEGMLRELGCEVAALSGNLSQALEVAATANFDFAVLDINIDGGPSYPVADLLIQRGVPMMFSTGYSTKRLPDRHADAVILHKPFSLEQLQAALARLPVPPRPSVDPRTR